MGYHMRAAWMGRKAPRTRHIPGKMNKTEAAYADYLEEQKAAGLIEEYRFEHMKIKLAELTFLSPDFLVVCSDHFEFHEVKGHWEDDARVKFKVAREMNPWFRWLMVRQRTRKDGGGWEVSE